MLTPPSEKLARALFAPRAVAIVGQSNYPGKTAGRPLKYLRQAGYGGRVYPINAGRESVLGERAWPSLSALPEVPEHAYIVTGTAQAVDAIRECGALGIKVATVLADGFKATIDQAVDRSFAGNLIVENSQANNQAAMAASAPRSSPIPRPAAIRSFPLLATLPVVTVATVAALGSCTISNPVFGCSTTRLAR